MSQPKHDDRSNRDENINLNNLFKKKTKAKQHVHVVVEEAETMILGLSLLKMVSEFSYGTKKVKASVKRLL